MSRLNFTDFANEVKRRGGEAMPAEYRGTLIAKGSVDMTPDEFSAVFMSGNRGRREGGTDCE